VRAASLAEAWHSRVMADEVVSHPFKARIPSAAQRAAGRLLAKPWRPATYSEN